ncbi:hypothetical protein D9M71_790300 [compost metagenome]
MSSAESTLTRDTICSASSRPVKVFTATSTPSSRSLTTRPEAMFSRWMSLARLFIASSRMAFRPRTDGCASLRESTVMVIAGRPSSSAPSAVTSCEMRVLSPQLAMNSWRVRLPARTIS